MVNRKKIFSTGIAWIGLASLLRSHHRYFFSFLKHVFTDYFAKQYERRPAIYIDTLLDSNIRIYPKAVRAYFDFIPIFLTSFGYMKETFGLKIKNDVDDFLRGLIDLYKNAGFVYKNVPTIFHGRQDQKAGLKILQLYERPRNYFPSLHVVLVSYTYFQTRYIVSKNSNNGNHAEAVDALFKRAVRVIEACLLTKQHGIRDVAGGLALITLKNNDFNAEIVENIVSAMFRDNLFDMDGQFINDVRSHILAIYREIVGGHIDVRSDGFYSCQLVSHIKTI